MLHLTDPTYLRYIVDGLHNQSIQQENLAALPEGLIGIYEEALPWEQNIQERGRFLQFFSAWALLKKEVSATLVSSLLNWPEQEVIDALATHTKWFNSPASGTFILYHERLRTYLLSKITSNELKHTNQRIIESCQHALELKKGDEWEIYALEHLPSHLLIPAMQDEEQGASIRKLVYDTSYWNRQLEISKGYDWSKKMMNLAMIWAAKQNTDELIECALNKIDLHYMEQNDAPRIVELVAQNDIETALQRIESFGGNDKEGLQRKFTLYMLCLMELTLLDSKDKPYRKSAIEKLLNHLDENIPVEHSLLNWNDFFPSYLMFKMACELAEMGVDYLRVYKRTDEWESDWIGEKGPYSGLNFEVFLKYARSINDERQKTVALTYIFRELSKQGKLEQGISVLQESLEYAYGISDEIQKSLALNAISTELSKHGKLDESFDCAKAISNDFWKSEALKDISRELLNQGKLAEALDCARGISAQWQKSLALSIITSELSRQGKIKEESSIMKEALDCASCISDEFYKSKALLAISQELSKQGKLKESIECARGISSKVLKIEALVTISTELAKQGKLKESESMMGEALDGARCISDEFYKSKAMSDISTQLVNQGKPEEALNCAGGISNDFWKSNALQDISKGQLKQGNFDGLLECAYGISDERQKSLALKVISTELSKQGKLKDALDCARSISDEGQKNLTLKAVSTELSKQGKLLSGALLILESIVCVSGISDVREKMLILTNISKKLSKQDKLEKAFYCVSNISDEWQKYEALSAISTELVKQGKLEESLGCARDISDESQKSKALVLVSTELSNQGKLNEAILVVQESLDCVRGIRDKFLKSEALTAISAELVKQGKIEEAELVIRESFDCAKSISDNFWKSEALKDISMELLNQGKLAEALDCARVISAQWQKSLALSTITTKLSRQGKYQEEASVMKEALDCAVGIGNGNKSESLKAISTELFLHGKLEESLLCARSISDEPQKSRAISAISIELSKQANYNLAEQTSFEIKITTNRHDCWKTIANQQKDQLGLLEAFKNKNKFQSEEAQSYYLKGWAESITVDDITDELAHLAIQALQHDSTSLENFLQVYAQHELFFGTPSQEKIDRLNKTLNLQWALDIIAQFPEE